MSCGGELLHHHRDPLERSAAATVSAILEAPLPIFTNR